MEFKMYNITMGILIIISIILLYNNLNLILYPISTIFEIIISILSIFILYESFKEYLSSNEFIHVNLSLNLSIILLGMMIFLICI